MTQISRASVYKITVWIIFLTVSLFVFCCYGAIKSLIRLHLKRYLIGEPLELLLQFDGVFYFAGIIALINLVFRIGLFPENVKLIIENCCQKFLRLPVQYILCSLILVWFALWAPHYLYWPWWMDLEHFSLSAHSWENGVKPYRDLIDFNFPGPIYVMWIIGKVFGWGNPMAANLVDILVFIALGLLTFRWSIIVFGSKSTGMMSYLLMARYYMSLDAPRVMQRDWYVIASGIGLLMVLQLTDRRHKYVFAGFVLAVTFVIRPYAFLLLPPVLVSLFQDNWGERLRTESAIKQLVLSGIISSFILWSPLVIHGIIDDFFRELLREIMLGKYEQEDPQTIRSTVLNLLNTKIIFSAFCTVFPVLYITRNDQKKLRTIMPWNVMFISILFYQPLCPVMHSYTEIPIEMVSALLIGIFWGQFEVCERITALSKLLLVVVWAWFYFPGFPDMLSARSTREALIRTLTGSDLDHPPPGWADHLKERTRIPFRYYWEDYQSVLKYIREETSSEVRVVNFLRSQPFPTLNGPTGRLSLWPCGEGIQWLRWVHPELELEFANVLKSQVPSIVIWNDRNELEKASIKLPLIDRMIRLEYEPVARYGNFDIWKKRGVSIRP